MFEHRTYVQILYQKEEYRHNNQNSDEQHASEKKRKNSAQITENMSHKNALK